MPLQSINPATGETLRSFQLQQEDGVRERIALAAGAGPAHAALPFEDRARCLRKLAQLLVEDCGDIAHAIALETGKPISAANVEVLRCSDLCSFLSEHGSRMLGREVLGVPSEAAGPRQSYLAWRPMGVLLAVVPWESPFWQAFRLGIPALSAGNAVLMKHASSVPQCALLLESLVRRAGFLRGAWVALLMEDRLVETALHDARVSAVAVIGTESAGRALAAQAGWLLKKSTVQVPGTGSTVVMPSADLDGALAAAVDALASGTDAGKHLVLHSGIYSDFVSSLVRAVESLRTGDPLKPETQIGPLGTRAALDILSEQVEAAVKAGGRVVTGGTRLVGSGLYFEPTLLSDIPRDATTALDMMTGPMLTISRARDAADAVTIANQTRHRGACSVWTREPAEQQQLVSGINGISVALNACPWPMGATRMIGQGAPPPGSSSLREWMEQQLVMLG